MTTSASRRAARLNHPRWDWARSLRVRRWLVVMTGASMLGGALALLLPLVLPHGPVRGVVPFLVFLVFLGAFTCCVVALRAGVRGLEQLGRDQLDERQWQVRGETYTSAYRVLSLLVVVAVIAALVLSTMTAVRPPNEVIAAVSMVLVLAAITLPTLVAGWHDRA